MCRLPLFLCFKLVYHVFRCVSCSPALRRQNRYFGGRCGLSVQNNTAFPEKPQLTQQWAAWLGREGGIMGFVLNHPNCRQEPRPSPRKWLCSQRLLQGTRRPPLLACAALAESRNNGSCQLLSEVWPLAQTLGEHQHTLLALLLRAVHFNSNLPVSWKASKSSKKGLARNLNQ